MIIPKWKSDAYVLVIAHPDDESMFFYPTLSTILNTSKTSSSSSNTTQLYILCLSNGNYNDLGSIREKELYKAASDIIGIPQNNISIVNNPEQMPDHPNKSWETTVVADTIESFLNKNCTYPQSISNVTLLTFDSGGVSKHPNHIDTWNGVRAILERRKFQQNKHQSSSSSHDDVNHLMQHNINLRAFQLQTIYFPLRKYFPPLDWMILLWNYFFLHIVRTFLFLPKNESSFITTYCFQPLQVWKAMKSHASQFVWYRKLSVLWSRYTYVNTWTEIIVEPPNKKVE